MTAPLGMLAKGATGTASGLKGTGMKLVQTPTMSPQKSAAYQHIFGQTSEGLAKGLGRMGDVAGGGDASMWSSIEGPAIKQFGGMTGQLASRFSGMGTGARKSSGFQQAMGGAAGDLAEKLQSQRMGLQQNAMSQLMSLYSQLMGQPEFESSLIPKKKPFWKELLGSAAGGLGQAGGMAAGMAAGGLF